MPAHFNQVIRKTIDFFQIQSTFNKSTQDSTAARCAQVDCKKVLFHGILSIYLKYSFTYMAKIDDSFFMLLTHFD